MILSCFPFLFLFTFSCLLLKLSFSYIGHLVYFCVHWLFITLSSFLLGCSLFWLVISKTGLNYGKIICLCCALWLVFSLFILYVIIRKFSLQCSHIHKSFLLNLVCSYCFLFKNYFPPQHQSHRYSSPLFSKNFQSGFSHLWPYSINNPFF